MITPESIRDESMARFNELAPAKYDAGQKEHSGLITDRDLLAEMEKEVIDQWHYLQSERIKRKRDGVVTNPDSARLDWVLRNTTIEGLTRNYIDEAIAGVRSL